MLLAVALLWSFLVDHDDAMWLYGLAAGYSVGFAVATYINYREWAARGRAVQKERQAMADETLEAIEAILAKYSEKDSSRSD